MPKQNTCTLSLRLLATMPRRKVSWRTQQQPMQAPSCWHSRQCWLPELQSPPEPGKNLMAFQNFVYQSPPCLFRNNTTSLNQNWHKQRLGKQRCQHMLTKHVANLSKEELRKCSLSRLCRHSSLSICKGLFREEKTWEGIRMKRERVNEEIWRMNR